MAKYLSTDALIESVKRRAMLPSTQNTFKEEDFLAFANEEMSNAVIPYVQSFREDYFIAIHVQPIETGVQSYRIPDRATGNKLRDIRFRDNSGNLYEMTRIFIEDEPYFQYSAGTDGYLAMNTFMVENNQIVFPNGAAPNVVATIEMIYYIRPNALVSEEDVAVITAIDTLTNTVTLSQVPEGFAQATQFDITSCKSPFSLVAMEITPTVLPTTSTPQMTFTALPRYISVGDVVALPEETTIPQIPLEVHSLLAQRVAMRCLEALGDTQGLQNAAAKMVEMEDKLGGLLGDRVEGAVKKVVNFHSNLRSSRRWTWR